MEPVIETNMAFTFIFLLAVAWFLLRKFSENPFERGNPTIIKETKKEEEKSPSAKRKTTKKTTEKQEENSLKEEANNEKGE